MPRAKKKGKRNKKRVRDELVASFWARLIRQGLDAKKTYKKIATEVKSYLGPDHSHLFDAAHDFMNFEGATAVAVPLIPKLRNTLGPRLYQIKPTRTVTPRTDDGVMLGLARALEAYLNYTAREAKLAKQLRKSIDDGMIRGRAVLMQEFEPIREIVTSRYVSSLDFVFDPDVNDIEEASWIAYRRVEPIWRVKRRISDKWRVKGLQRKPDPETHAPSMDKEGTSDKDSHYSAPRVEIWTVLSKMGAGFRGMDEASRFNDPNDFVKLEIVLDHEVPLSEGEWDVPFYLDRDWPIAYKDLIEPVDEPWPDSLSGQVLGSQKAIDLLSTIRITSVKNRDRFLAFVDSHVMADEEAIQTFRHGSSADLIPLKLPSGKTLQDAVMMMNFGVGSSEGLIEREFHIKQTEEVTGVNEAAHGGTTPGGGVERSATASAQKADALNIRISDLRHRVEEFHSDAAAKEAIIVRLLLDSDQVDPIVRTSDINLYYVRVDVPGGASVPVRDIRSEEERKEGPGPSLTLEDLSPQASNFFQTPEEAFESAVRLWEEMVNTQDPRVAQLATSLDPAGLAVPQVDPASGQEIPQLPQGVSVDVVTVDLVWEATAGLTPEELMREFSYELGTGSGHKLTKEAEQENANNLTQTWGPAALADYQATGDPTAVNQIMEIRNEAFDIPQDKRFKFPERVPPAPAGGDQPPAAAA